MHNFENIKINVIHNRLVFYNTEGTILTLQKSFKLYMETELPFYFYILFLYFL